MSTTKPETRADLLARIAKALKDDRASSATLYDLAADAQRASALAGLDATNARQRALDPGLLPDEVDVALKEKSQAEFDAERIEAARIALEARAADKAERETAASQKAGYDAAVAERDRVAKRLKEEYPALQKALVDLLSDLALCNETVDLANKHRPEGSGVIQRAEGRARGFHDRDEMQDGGAPYNLEIARLSQMVLPEFDDPKILAWPARWPLWRLQEIGIYVPSYTFAQNAWRKAR